MLKKPDNVSFVNNADGESVPQEYMELLQGELEELKSFIYPLNKAGAPMYANPIAQAGIPGNVFYEGITDLNIYSQGETIALEAGLVVDQAYIKPEDWVVEAYIKTSPHNICPTWKGTLNNGIYYKSEFDRFQIWIDYEETGKWFEGLYTIEIVVTENPIAHNNPKDRRIVLLSYNFSIRYTTSSPHPESVEPSEEKLRRSDLKSSFPETYSTIKL